MGHITLKSSVDGPMASVVITTLMIRKSKNQEFNAYSAYYNFSEFKNDTVIHYDILAGENYRSEPLSSAQKTAVISDDN